MINLTELKAGEKARFAEVAGGKGIAAKLEAMGVTPGAVITKVSAQIMHGPIIIKSGTTELAIGFKMAKKIMVKKIGE